MFRRSFNYINLKLVSTFSLGKFFVCTIEFSNLIEKRCGDGLMEKIYSVSSPGVLNHMIFRREDLESLKVGRVDLSEYSEFLQLAAMRIPNQTSFAAHTHLDRVPSFDSLRAQESWIVVAGIVQVDYYDGDDLFQESFKLHPGDVSITFYGGHGYSISDGESLVYEIKSGPYEGREKDKRIYNAQ